MTKLRLTADDIDMLMQESDIDSSESDHDDSCDDANWDPDPFSSDGSDFDSDESETEAAAMDMDDSVTAASDTNGSSLDQSASEDDDDSNDSTILISGNWTDFVGRQQSFTFSDQSGLLKTLAPNCSPLACASCYAKAKKEGGRDGARKNSSKSYTFCDLCPGQPQMCRKCFNELHK